MHTLGLYLKKALILGSESVKMPIRGVLAAMRVVKKHSKIFSIVSFLCLKQLVSNPLSLLCVSKVATELTNRNNSVFRTVNKFNLVF